MNGIRLARVVSAAAVAGIAAWSSYSHMIHVALHYGERPEVAVVLPLSVDGMLVVASAAMVDDRRSGRRVRPVARVAFTAGVAASMAANIAAAHSGLGARVVAAWPAVALLLVVEMLSHTGRPLPRPDTVVPAASDATDRDHPVSAGSGTTPPTSGAGQPPPPSPAAPTRPPPKADRQALTTRAAVGRTGRPADQTRQLALQIMAEEPAVTKTELAARVGVSPRRLRRVLQETP